MRKFTCTCLVLASILTAQGASAGTRDFALMIVDGSGPMAGTRATRLLEMFRRDFLKFARGDDGVNIKVADADRAKDVFEPGCGGKLRDTNALHRLVSRGDIASYDAVLFYCYEETPRRVTLVMFDDDTEGTEVLRTVISRLYEGPPTDEMHGLILKDGRAAVVKAFLAMFPWDV